MSHYQDNVDLFVELKSYYHCTGNKGGFCKKDYIREEKLIKLLPKF